MLITRFLAFLLDPAVHGLVDKEAASFIASAFSVFLFRDTGQCAESAGPDTCRLKPVFYPFVAAVTLDHLPVGGTVSGSAEGTCHSAALAADAIGVVVDRETGIRILGKASGRTGGDAWSIRAMHAGDRQIREVVFSIRCFELCIVGFTVALFAGCEVCVILIHAAHHASRARAAFVGVKLKDIFHFSSPRYL